MKKLLFTLILSVVMISIQSCTTTYAAVYDQYDEEYVISDNADVNIIITYGTPYYYEGKLWYYLYNGLYYYPFHYNGYWYFRPYGTLYSWDWYHYHYHHFTPNYHDYRFRPHYKNWNRPHHDGRRPGGHGKAHHNRPKDHQPNAGHGSHKPNNGGVRPNGNSHRHNQNGRSRMNNGRPSSRPSNGGAGLTIKPSRSHRPSNGGSGMSRPSSGRRR